MQKRVIHNLLLRKWLILLCFMLLPTVLEAYWFDERVTNRHIYPDGFYHTEHYYFPHKNVMKYVDMDKLPKFTEWKVEEPIEGERYLVYRVGCTSWYSPHYTIRKYHNGSFGSKDVKYWIRLKDLIEHEFNSEWRIDNENL